MPIRYLSDAELARLSGWPEEIADEDAVTYFTLTGDDLGWLAGFNVGRAARRRPRAGYDPAGVATPWRDGRNSRGAEGRAGQAGVPAPARADRLDLSRLPTGRRRMLAGIGRRSTNQALQRAYVDRRYPVLLATLAETYVEVLYELVQLLDQALAGAESRARHELSERVVERARAETERIRLLDELLDELLDVLADPAVSDAEAGRLIRRRIGMPPLIAARRPVEEREPRDHGHFDLLATRYKYLRTFTPAGRRPAGSVSRCSPSASSAVLTVARG